MRNLALASIVLLVLACSASGNRRVLSFFFDGVPREKPVFEPIIEPETLPEDDVARPAAPTTEPEVELPSAAELAAAGFSAIDELPLRPVPKKTEESWTPTDAPLEKATSWDEAVAILPWDSTAGVDWVAAVRLGLYVPQQVLDIDSDVPFDLDTLVVAGADQPTSPFFDFDVAMTPDSDPFFEVTFPHSSHTLFLSCASCHPGVQEWDVPMDRIFAGQACGKCHGKVSFPLETGCPRCHQKLAFPEEPFVDGELERAAREPIAATPEVVARGKEVYEQKCLLCHGAAGDGKGRVAPYLTTKPRDFTAGKFKIRSTLGLDPPTDLDLFRTITRGIPRSSMPAWPQLSYEDRWSLVHYVKTFTDVFDRYRSEHEGRDPEPFSIPEPPPETPEILAAGKELYVANGCDACHGAEGDGNGPSAALLKDDWGNPIRPYNFSSGTPPKGGERPRDIYRVIMNGFPGTPMPAFAESLTEDKAWALARYVYAFRGTKPAPLSVTGDVPFSRGGPAPGTGPGAAADDPFGGGQEDPFGGGGDDPFADDPFAGGGDPDDPFAEPPPTDPNDPFAGPPPADPNDPFAEPPTDPNDPFASPPPTDPNDPFASPAPADPNDPFAEPPTDPNDPFAAPADPNDPFAAALDEPPSPSELEEYPPAVFPHWFHRIRLKCSNCHTKVFEMKAGADPINMDAMRAGLYCAKCHNGKIAWEIGFTTCQRCHQQRVEP